MLKVLRIMGLIGILVILGSYVPAEEGTSVKTEVAGEATPADGHNIHVLAPHVVDGKVMGPFHHYCKVLSQEPVIECLIYESTMPNARLTEIEYIVAKTLTREIVPLDNWNKNWHDHKIEIATGRVVVLDLPSEKAKEVADLVATTDGIIFHLWPPEERLPNGKVLIAQAVGHKDLKWQEYKEYNK